MRGPTAGTRFNGPVSSNGDAEIGIDHSSSRLGWARNLVAKDDNGVASAPSRRNIRRGAQDDAWVDTRAGGGSVPMQRRLLEEGVRVWHLAGRRTAAAIVAAGDHSDSEVGI